jgi:hypothetical protein
VKTASTGTPTFWKLSVVTIPVFYHLETGELEPTHVPFSLLALTLPLRFFKKKKYTISKMVYFLCL